MRAGAMREFLDFYERQSSTSESGAVKHEWVNTFSRRAAFKSSKPVYDKDGVEARELYRGQTIYMVIRMDCDIKDTHRIKYKGDMYEIILIKPNYNDRTYEIQMRKLNE